jgi:hypothetical protein
MKEVRKDWRGTEWRHAYGNMWEKQEQASYYVNENKLDPKSPLIPVTGLTGTLKHSNDLLWG